MRVRVIGVDCTRAGRRDSPPVWYHFSCRQVLRRLAAIVLLPALGLSPGALRAQRQTYTNTNAWFVINGDVALNERWGVLFDASARRSGPVHEAMANFVRGGVALHVNEHVRVAAGANWSRSYPYGELPSDYPVTERRLWQQAVLSHDIGRLEVSHRYRLEQRWRGRREDPLVDRIASWERTSRFRYQVKATLPLDGVAVDPGEAYFSASNEIFIGFGRHVEYNMFDQDRATATLGYRFTRNWRGEVGFLEHVVFKGNGTDVERNHTMTFALSFTRPAPSAPKIGSEGSR